MKNEFVFEGTVASEPQVVTINNFKIGQILVEQSFPPNKFGSAKVNQIQFKAYFEMIDKVKHAKKGDKVFIMGILNGKSFADKTTGAVRYFTDHVVKVFEIITPAAPQEPMEMIQEVIEELPF